MWTWLVGMLVTAAGAAMAGEVADMKVTEPIEKGGSVVSPAKLPGELKTNSSTAQPVRFFEGKIQFIDTQGQPIRSDEKQIKPTIKLQTYGATERLDPAQDAPRPWPSMY
jgi:hypothetical protein